MDAFIKNSATILCFIASLGLPIYTLTHSWNGSISSSKTPAYQHGSILELSLKTAGHSPDQLEQLERLNLELNGVITVINLP